MSNIPPNIIRLCSIMNCAAGHVCDIDLAAVGVFSVNPDKVEKLMTMRGQFDDEKSIRDNVENAYGREAVELIEKSF